MKLFENILRPNFSRESFSVGLDIGSSEVKAVKLKLSKDKAELCGFNLEPAKENLAQTIKNIVKGYNVDRANISLSGPAAIIRYVNFPMMNEEELKKALKFEAQKHIPFSVDEVNLDAHILKTNLPNSQMLILLAAARKDFIKQRLKIMEEIGIGVDVVNIDSLCLINAFNFNYGQDEQVKQKTVALLNIGAMQSNLSILEAGMPRFSRDINIAGNNFTQKIADNLGIDLKIAEEKKINPDKENSEKIALGLESWIINLANEIRVSFDYYESQGASSVAKIFLSGGGSLFKGVKESLAKALDIEVEYWDPFNRIIPLSSIDAQRLGNLSGQLTVAAGLALHC